MWSHYPIPSLLNRDLSHFFLFLYKVDQVSNSQEILKLLMTGNLNVPECFIVDATRVKFSLFILYRLFQFFSYKWLP